MKKWIKFLAIVLVLCLVGNMLPVGEKAARADSSDSALELGDNVYHFDPATEKEWYSFDNATGDGTGAYEGFIIYFTKIMDVNKAPSVELPRFTDPRDECYYLKDVFTKSSVSDDYSIVLDIGTIKVSEKETRAANSDDVAKYIQRIQFLDAEKQEVQFAVSTNKITNPTYYYSDNQHYYQFIDTSTMTWIEAYAEAMKDEYLFMGRICYLATPTTLDEDKF